MTNNDWFITGAGRGMGLDITKAALAAGHRVVATGRNTDKVAQAVGESANLFVVKLDVTKRRLKQAGLPAHYSIRESRLDCCQRQNLLRPMIRWCVNTPWH
jgi:NAD(P)-dependent dehydrogenase (short-subunit alcohol dehydrogenase family)